MFIQFKTGVQISGKNARVMVNVHLTNYQDPYGLVRLFPSLGTQGHARFLFHYIIEHDRGYPTMEYFFRLFFGSFWFLYVFYKSTNSIFINLTNTMNTLEAAHAILYGE